MKRVTLYAAMIALFLATELWLLHRGRHLVPPPAIAGDWLLHTDGMSSCAQFRGTPPPSMSIAQSGLDVQIDLGGVRLSGLIDHGALHTDADAPCTVQARLDGTRPPTLRGDIQGLAFTAVRKEKP